MERKKEGCEPRWQVWEGKESRGGVPPFLRKVLLPLPNSSQSRLFRALQESFHLLDVLVAATGETHQQRGVLGQCGSHFDGLRQGMGGFERGDDALRAGQQEKRVHGFLVGHADVIGASYILEIAVLGADGRII